MASGQRMRSLTWRITALLVGFVAISIVIMAGLGYSRVDQATEEYAAIRIDRAARAAASITAATLQDRFTVLRDQEGRPTAIQIIREDKDAVLTPQPTYAALLVDIGAVNQGAANLFRLNAHTHAFDRFGTTFRGPNNSEPPPFSLGPSHPAYAALSAKAVHVGQVPIPGGLRLAYFIPILDISGALAGAMAIDVGWVNELVHRRKELRDDIALWSGLILVVVALAGGLMAYRQMRPLRSLAGFAHDLAAARDIRDVPGRGRGDEIGFLAEGLSRVVELRGNLERLAYGDPLTGLANRARYFDNLGEVLAGAHKGSRKAALLMLDLDRFKETNDAFGQNAGDDLLVRARDIILAELEEGDNLARLGGDDFVILSLNARDEVQAQDLCRRLIERLAVPISMPQGEIHTGCSIGIAMLPRDGESAEEAHRNADLALRQAKHEGRSRFVFFDHELHAAAQKRMTLARMLRHALENDELTVHVQPQVRLKDARLHGFEVLARWFHPTSGAIPPSEFIPVAEANGLIPALGNRVLDEACRIAREWADARFEFGHVSVNVSTIQLWQPNFVAIVADALRRHGLPGYRLCLEVTESVFVNHGEAKVMRVFGELRALGVTLSLDDFGSGYSSLGYLNTLPLDQLKIDRAFVSGVDKDPRKRSLLAGIIALGKGLRLELVAEGAEKAAEVEVLRSLGCNLVQGYYFAKPMPHRLAQAEAERIRKSLRPQGKVKPERVGVAAA